MSLSFYQQLYIDVDLFLLVARQYLLSLSTAVHWCWFVPNCGKAAWGAQMQCLLCLSTAVQWCWFVPTCGKAAWGAKMQCLLLLSTAVQWCWFVPTCGKAVPPLSVNSCTEMLIFDLFLLVTRQCEVLKCSTSSLCQQLYRDVDFWFVPTCDKAVWGAKMQYLLSLSTAVQRCWFLVCSYLWQGSVRC